VRAWARSGTSAREFAASRGVSARSLSWWKWRLSKDQAQAARRGPATAGVELVPVDVVDDGTDGGECWELRTAKGHLRVHGALGTSELHVVLDALGLRGARA